MLKLEYSERMEWISWLLMPWLLVARPSAAMTFTTQDKLILIYHEVGLQIPAPSQCSEILKKKCKYVFIFPKINSAHQGLRFYSMRSRVIYNKECTPFTSKQKPLTDSTNVKKSNSCSNWCPIVTYNRKPVTSRSLKKNTPYQMMTKMK